MTGKSSAERWFYSCAAILLLVLTLIGFRLFYLEGQAFPGRPLTPPIRTLLIVHGVLMTLWMVLSVVQPLLVATRCKRMHMKLGGAGLLLACGIVFAGLRVGIEATRITPPELRLFGLTPVEFLLIPVGSVAAFGLFVLVGILYRRRPEIHRPMMLMASLSVVSAATGRMPALNDWMAGTWVEQMFTSFLPVVALSAVLLVVKCQVSKTFDRWFAVGCVAVTAFSVAFSLGAKTEAWGQFASFLLR